MTKPRSATYHYSIDADDRLVVVSDTWLAFARENDAPELTRDQVLGRPLWRFVSGSETTEIYQLLFDWVRSCGAQVKVPFRCDSPDQIRFMCLHLNRSEGQGIDMAAVLERVVPRTGLRLLERMATRADYSFEICSFCRRIFAFGAWLEPEQAVERLGWLESETPPQLEDGICEPCQRKNRALIASPSH